MPNWYRSCITATGPCQVDCGGCGCDMLAGVCSDVYRADILLALPAPGQEPETPHYFWGRFIDGKFILSDPGHLADHGVSKGDALISINGRGVDQKLFREMCCNPPVIKAKLIAEVSGQVVTIEIK